MSRVDVIIPCYNYGRFLRECVGSVLSQQVDLRILVIDDCSSDDTPEVAAALAAEDSRVEFRRHAVNRRHIATYNEGLEWVSGDYNLLLSADDLLAEGALLRAVRLLDAHPEVGLVYGKALPFRSGSLPTFATPLQGEESWKIDPGALWIESVCRDGCNPIFSPEAVVRTRLQKEVGGYRPELPHTGDLEMWLRFACLGDVGRVDATQALYRLHGQNMSESYIERSESSVRASLGLKDLIERKAAFEFLFREMKPLMPDGDRLERTAIEGLAWNAFWSASTGFERGDEKSCEEFLDLARTLLPEIVASREWSRMMWKRRIGTRAWSKLGGLVRAARSLRRRSRSPRAALS